MVKRQRVDHKETKPSGNDKIPSGYLTCIRVHLFVLAALTDASAFPKASPV